ncbi:hypothetical protein [Mucilaginibacter glaciei]|uniref:Uncharacterized protein n=1 Tax=Mucilaginibacter glaciei TaxID=2772109 RepID=A0A926NQU7_9SPHI|nr:hypothetical protein [Mucilaginibacter glaciei]MBD1393362.1 hypothetical protein [Mucilaginibacter glaciei]
MDVHRLLSQTKTCIWIMIFGLALSGLTAFPIESELRWLVKYYSLYPTVMTNWLQTIYAAIVATNQQYPYLSYGTDWLAFAHLMLAVLFIGPLKDPVKNIWVIEFGMIACVCIIPLAFIAGSIRQIPIFWRLIDCSFGVISIIPLAFCYHNIKRLNSFKTNSL